MSTIISRDGTRIGYNVMGEGPAVIVVDGALVYRAFSDENSVEYRLADHFTVYSYDRRGRGESTDTLPYAIEREIEDIEALINDAGGAAFVFGSSSGAALAMEAALQLGGKVAKLAMYEPPYNTEDAGQQAWREYTRQLGELLRADRRGDAVALFIKVTGASDEQITGMRQSPIWSVFEAVAPTLAYDHCAILGEDSSIPVERAARLAVPTLVINGSETYPFIQAATKALAEAIPSAQHRVLPGQTHEVASEALAPVLAEFFGSGEPVGKHDSSVTEGKPMPG